VLLGQNQCKDTGLVRNILFFPAATIRVDLALRTTIAVFVGLTSFVIRPNGVS
jgi:hypothetical protein